MSKKDRDTNKMATNTNGADVSTMDADTIENRGRRPDQGHVPEFALRDLLKANYGAKSYMARFTEHMGMTRATAYNYSRDGVPERLANTFRAFCIEEEIDFPEGKSAEDYIRFGQDAPSVNLLEQKNVHLIRMIEFLVGASFKDQLMRSVNEESKDLLCRLDELLAARFHFDIEDICRLNFDTVPQRFFRWAYQEGGAPQARIEHVIRSALQHKMHATLFDFSDDPQGRSAFRAWAETYLVSIRAQDTDAEDTAEVTVG